MANISQNRSIEEFFTSNIKTGYKNGMKNKKRATEINLEKKEKIIVIAFKADHALFLIIKDFCDDDDQFIMTSHSEYVRSAIVFAKININNFKLSISNFNKILQSKNKEQITFKVTPDFKAFITSEVTHLSIQNSSIKNNTDYFVATCAYFSGVLVLIQKFVKKNMKFLDSAYDYGRMNTVCFKMNSIDYNRIKAQYVKTKYGTKQNQSKLYLNYSNYLRDAIIILIRNLIDKDTDRSLNCENDDFFSYGEGKKSKPKSVSCKLPGLLLKSIDIFVNKYNLSRTYFIKYFSLEFEKELNELDFLISKNDCVEK